MSEREETGVNEVPADFMANAVSDEREMSGRNISRDKWLQAVDEYGRPAAAAVTSALGARQAAIDERAKPMRWVARVTMRGEDKRMEGDKSTES